MAAVLCCALLFGAMPARAAEGVFGRWFTDDRSAVVAIARCGGHLCGRIERVLDPAAPRNDVNNPDRQRRDEPLVGTLVLQDYSGSGAKWTDGQAYDPKTGNSYRSQLTLLDDGRLKVTGCVLFLCRSRYWTRVD